MRQYAAFEIGLELVFDKLQDAAARRKRRRGGRPALTAALVP